MAIQAEFRDAGGLPLLVHLVATTSTGAEDPSEEQREANVAATEALFFLTRNNSESRRVTCSAHGDNPGQPWPASSR